MFFFLLQHTSVSVWEGDSAQAVTDLGVFLLQHTSVSVLEGDNAQAVTDLGVFLLQHTSVSVWEGDNAQAVSDLCFSVAACEGCHFVVFHWEDDCSQPPLTCVCSSLATCQCCCLPCSAWRAMILVPPSLCVLLSCRMQTMMIRLLLTCLTHGLPELSLVIIRLGGWHFGDCH